jgi:periplasmic mercuric ion binding protein
MKNIILALALIVPVLTGFKSSGTAGKVSEVVVQTSVVCDMCKERIEKYLVFEKGVKEVAVDVEKKTVTVKYNAEKTSPEKIRIAIAKLGYRADNVVADEKAFNSLPACCKKEGCGK